MRRWPWLRLITLALALALLLPAPGTLHAAAPALRLPVIFVPGLGGSELWDGDSLIWVDPVRAAGSQLPGVGNWLSGWLRPLALRPDGATPASSEADIALGDVMRAGPTGIYGALLERLAAEGYQEGRNLFVFPYDWRRTIDQSAGELAPFVREALRRNPGADQVILVAHSMGGLVARSYIQFVGVGKVRALIALGTPWMGSALAYKALARGWNLGLELPGTPWAIRAPKILHELAQNFPSIYQLVPGKHYAAQSGGFALADGKPLPLGRALAERIMPHNPGLAAGAGYTDRLLDGKPYGAEYFILAGTGRATLVAAEETGGAEGAGWREVTTDGDDMVPLFSADLGHRANPQQSARYLGPLTRVAYVNRSHTFMPASPQAQDQVAIWLQQIQDRRR